LNTNISKRLRFFRGCLLPSLLLFCLSGWAAAGDFLTQPAFVSDDLSAIAVMDIERIGTRLVAVGERGMIMFSDDQGRTWKQAQVPVRTTLTALCFSSPENGWAVGHESTLLHSRDHGETWEKIFDGCRVNTMMVNAMQVVVEQKKEQLMQAPESEKFDLNLQLEDARTNLRGFQETQIEGPIQPLLDVWFADQSEGLLIGAFGIILRTTDGGSTWTPLLDRINNPMGYHLAGFARSENGYFIFGEAGGMFHSDDHGQHWESLPSPYEGSFFGALNSHGGKLVAGFGLRGSLVISYDGGVTWDYQKLGVGAALNGAALLLDNQFVIVGMAGEIYVGSESHTGIHIVKTGFPACMAVADAGDGYLVLAGLKGVRRFKMNSVSEKEVN